MAIGTVNTVLLLSSSAVSAWGLGQIRLGDKRRLFRACVVVGGLGVIFLLLKGWERKSDLHQHLFPGPAFSIAGPLNGGAQLFWMFYWVATALHGVHMIVGVGLVAWLGLLVLIRAEFLLSRFSATRAAMPFVGVGMEVFVALTIMRLGNSRGLVPIFALPACSGCASC